MNRILKQFDLERKDLDFKCPRRIRDRIADEIIHEWYLIGRVLNLSEARLRSIRHNNVFTSPEEKAVAVLDAWDEEYASGATCLKLAEALHERRKMRIVEILCKEVTQQVKHEKTTRAAQFREELIKEEAEATATDAEKCTSLRQSTFFEEAKIKAKVPFLHHQVLECDSSGLEFNVVKHDITVEISKGCVSEGEKLCLEVGVAMYGPFKFTDDSQPISPILWLCFLNEDVKVKKPIKITVPHFLTGLTESRLREHRVSFAKANHKDYIPQEDYIVYNFEPSEDETQFISRDNKSYGVLETTHCCFLCIRAEMTPRLGKYATYCLTRVERTMLGGSEINFAATYCHDTCIEALEKQFPIEDGYRIVSRKIFRFKECEAVPLKITVPENPDKYIVAKDPWSAEIRASDIDFWSKGFSDMLLEDELNIYPPRVKIEVISKTNDPLNIVMKFSGSQDDRELNLHVAFPLAAQNTATSLDQPASTLTQQHTTDVVSEQMVSTLTPLSLGPSGEGHLSDIYHKLKLQASRWRDIGIDLGLREGELNNILAQQSTASGVSSFQHNAPQNTATSLDQPALTLTQQHTTDGDVKAWNRKSVCESESEETVRRVPKVKSGRIEDPDRLFNNVAIEIGHKYGEVGINLGLRYTILQNELDTGIFMVFSESKKAMKMLQLWRDSVVEDDFTYSALAAALEKTGFMHCANKYCYT